MSQALWHMLPQHSEVEAGGELQIEVSLGYLVKPRLKTKQQQQAIETLKPRFRYGVKEGDVASRMS